MSAILSALINGMIVSASIAAVVWVVMRFTASTRIWNAATRYAVWWATLLIGVILPVLYIPIQRAPVVYRAASVPALQQGRWAGIETGKGTSTAQPPDSTPQAVVGVERAAAHSLFPIQLTSGRWVTWAVLGWVVLSFLMLARLAVSHVMLERAKRRAYTLPAYETRVEEWLACCSAGGRRARLAVSADIATPVAAGPYRPTILIPARMVDALSEDELRQIGLHEAAHLSRRDDYALILERILQAVFVLQPVIHWIARRLDLEREMACDDIVVQITRRPASYAACLARVVELSGPMSASRLAASAAESKSGLERRVEVLLDNPRNAVAHLLKLRLVAAIAVLGLMVWTASGVLHFVVLASPPVALTVEPVQESPRQAIAPQPAEPLPIPVAAPLAVQQPAVVNRQAASTAAPQQLPDPASAAVALPSSLVWLPVVVTDSRQRYVSGLAREHFRILEDDVEQDIAEFVAPTRELSVAVVLDIRNGTEVMQLARETGAEFLRSASPEDEFTLRSMQSSGPDSLLEGVRLGLTGLTLSSNRRKVVLIISDADDRSDSNTAEQVNRLVGSTDVPVYAVSMNLPDAGRVNDAAATLVPSLLDTLTEQSGGRRFAIGSANEISDVMNRISIELRMGYLLGYYPRNAIRDGRFRRIGVELLPPKGIQRLIPIVRSGYTASVQQR